MEFGWLVEAVLFADVDAISNRCNIVDAKWLYNWTGYSHRMFGRAKTRMVAIRHSQIESRLL